MKCPKPLRSKETKRRAMSGESYQQHAKSQVNAGVQNPNRRRRTRADAERERHKNSARGTTRVLLKSIIGIEEKRSIGRASALTSRNEARAHLALPRTRIADMSRIGNHGGHFITAKRQSKIFVAKKSEVGWSPPQSLAAAGENHSKRFTHPSRADNGISGTKITRLC